jgi:hypothetical protein
MSAVVTIGRVSSLVGIASPPLKISCPSTEVAASIGNIRFLISVVPCSIFLISALIAAFQPYPAACVSCQWRRPS